MLQGLSSGARLRGKDELSFDPYSVDIQEHVIGT